MGVEELSELIITRLLRRGFYPHPNPPPHQHACQGREVFLRTSARETNGGESNPKAVNNASSLFIQARFLSIRTFQQHPADFIQDRLQVVQHFTVRKADYPVSERF